MNINQLHFVLKKQANSKVYAKHEKFLNKKIASTVLPKLMKTLAGAGTGAGSFALGNSLNKYYQSALRNQEVIDATNKRLVNRKGSLLDQWRDWYALKGLNKAALPLGSALAGLAVGGIINSNKDKEKRNALLPLLLGLGGGAAGVAGLAATNNLPSKGELSALQESAKFYGHKALDFGKDFANNSRAQFEAFIDNLKEKFNK